MRRSSRVLIVGLVLLFLGLGNLLMSDARLTNYEAQLDAAVELGGEAARKPLRGTASILDPAHESRLLYESAQLKRDYYLVIYRGGRFLSLLGTVLILGALLRRWIVPASG